MTFGETLRNLRQARQGTLANFSKEIGVSAGQLSRLERGMTGSVSASMLRPISNAYGISTDELLDLLDGSNAE